jgi:hypothetical protein
MVSERTMPGIAGPVTLAQDFYLEARGGVTVLRLVHSGFPDGSGWDHEFNGTKSGWPIYFRILRHGLTRHRGAAARNFDLYALSGDPVDRTWERLGVLRPADAVATSERCAWWTLPDRNDAMVHLACSAYGPKTGIWMSVATYDLPEDAVAAIRRDYEGTLHRTFPEQSADVCA